LAPKSFIGRVPEDMAEAVLKDLKENWPKGTREAMVVGFEVKVKKRTLSQSRVQYTEKILKFPIKSTRTKGIELWTGKCA
jgi:hypothetical protein